MPTLADWVRHTTAILLPGTPVVMALLMGMVVAFGYRRRAPRAAALAIQALMAIFAATVGVAGLDGLAAAAGGPGGTPAEVGVIRLVGKVAGAAVQAAGLAMLVRAVFVGRPAPPADD